MDSDYYDDECDSDSLGDFSDEDGDETDNNSLGSFSDEDGDELGEEVDDFKAKSHHDYTVLSVEDIRQHQEEDVARITSVLSVSRASAWILLLHYNWNVSAVYEAWYEDEEKVRTTTGWLDNPEVQSSDTKEVRCRICFEDYPGSSMYAVACGHLFCRSCWGDYISIAIKDGPGCLTLRCPDPKCRAAVGLDTVDELAPEGGDKYSHYLTGSYVETSKNIKWCPAPGCEHAVNFEIGSTNYDVSCSCTNKFCWNCSEDAHRPLGCDIVAKWILKNNSESENTNWILANSKPCPKCSRPIEKNQGCMHMTCSPPCKYHFCWLCLGSWSAHNGNTGGFYACNRYEEAKKTGTLDEAERTRERAKQSLERYTHYYERWTSNEASRKKAIESLQEVEASLLDELVTNLNEPRGQLSFIKDAWEQIIECRRVLKWTYAYGYYLPTEEDAKVHFFEYLQCQAESSLERLHQWAEKELQVYRRPNEQLPDFADFREKLSHQTSVTQIYFENLVTAIENDLAEVCAEASSSSSHTLLIGQIKLKVKLIP